MTKEKLYCDNCETERTHYLKGYNSLGLAVYQCPQCLTKRRGPTF